MSRLSNSRSRTEKDKRNGSGLFDKGLEGEQRNDLFPPKSSPDFPSFQPLEMIKSLNELTNDESNN